MIPWARISGPLGFFIGFAAATLIFRDGWAGVNWGPVLLGVGTGIVWSVASLMRRRTP